MADQAAIRVVLLAREGEARTRLTGALEEAGAALVLVADPLSTAPDLVADAQPQAILVALEPAIEDVLERFESLLSNPEITVVFDEAEVAAQRAGWDAARWVRHLAAKLNHHGDVLPPGWELENDILAAPGSLHDASDDAGGHALAPSSGEALEHPHDLAHDDAPASTFDFGLDLVPATADADWGQDWSEGSELRDSDQADAPGTAQDAQVTSFSFDEAIAHLELAPEDAEILEPEIRGGQRLERDLDALDQQQSGLSLADEDSYGHGPLRGAVVVEGGLGGPDALRQLLGAMPEAFARPLLVRLHLDGGRYDRLVNQMQRASSLPVLLAVEGQIAEAGTAYFLSPAVSIERSGAQLRFASAGDADVDLFAVLPANDSAVLVLSGTSDVRVDPFAAARANGALVVCQSPESCYDAAASTRLIEGGAEQADASALAARLVERWPS